MARDFQRPFPVPAGATEIVLVRHGSIAADRQGDPPLAPLGLRQADAVAERLCGEPAAGMFVTPLRRTAETAAPLAARLGHAAAVIEELREVGLGDWAGQFSVRIAGPESATIFAAQRWDAIPNAEDMDGFCARIRRGTERVADAVGPDATAIAVLHGSVIAEICRQATDSAAFAFLYAENGSISRVLRLRDGRWVLRSFNDTAHLAAITMS